MKRVYEKREPKDGARFLIDRLWPRGLKKSEVHLDAWVKDAGAGNHSDVRKAIPDAAKHAIVTLLYSAHDAEHNNASALKRILDAKLAHKKLRAAAAKKYSSERKTEQCAITR
ncbi:MAG TPA: DUF488 family protein [Bryobacteraceae bacterium]